MRIEAASRRRCSCARPVDRKSGEAGEGYGKQKPMRGGKDPLTLTPLLSSFQNSYEVRDCKLLTDFRVLEEKLSESHPSQNIPQLFKIVISERERGGKNGSVPTLLLALINAGAAAHQQAAAASEAALPPSLTSAAMAAADLAEGE